MIGEYMVYLCAALGLTVTTVVVTSGPGVWCRERLLRPSLPRLIGAKATADLLGCPVCASAWAGAAVGLVVWLMTGAVLPLATLWLVAPWWMWVAARIGGR